MKSYPLSAKEVVNSILNSYSQVFFSTSKLLALLLVLISFFDYGAGMGGILAILTANLLAWVLGYNRYYLVSGIYGFNALLAGLGIGLFYEPSPELFLLTGVAAIICFFLTIVLQGVLGKYRLPFLSIPFLITVWVVSLSRGDLSALHFSERGIYTYNELYALGGHTFVWLYDFLESSISSSFLKIYFHSLGAVFFQTHLLAGIIIATGLLIYSRISFVLSVLGYTGAWMFYKITGIEFNTLGYTFIGFNYILTAIALGGYYLVPGRVSFAWIILLLPTVVLITTATQQFFVHFKISPYSLPFNMVVLMFLYALKLREQRPKKLVETPVQLGNPEKNLYLYTGNLKRFPAAYPVSASLPFFGEWTINQAHNGEHTHKGAWRHAWDFVVTDRTGSQYKGSGDFVEDYFCFGKAVLSPFDGVVADVANNIQDNRIGDINTASNWGNTVIIKHNEYLYAKLSHLKFHSVEVKPGDFVKKGQLLARCGNSGRSPYPHLHFQFQVTPYIGSATFDYPFGHYLLKETNGFSLKNFDFPQINQVVVNPAKNESLVDTLHFIPGQKINVSLQVESAKKKWKQYEGASMWVVETDIYNNTYIRSEEDGSIAYLYNNGDVHYFTNFNGQKNSALYWFFITMFKIPFGFQPNSKIDDSLPVNLMFGGFIKFLQDFIAPAYLFLKANYRLTMKEAGDILSAGDIEMNASITQKVAGRETRKIESEIKIEPENHILVYISFKDVKISLKCQNQSE